MANRWLISMSSNSKTSYRPGSSTLLAAAAGLRPLVLSPTERADLVAFLLSLTDPEFVADPQFR
jgi:hypothetical protein